MTPIPPPPHPLQRDRYNTSSSPSLHSTQQQPTMPAPSPQENQQQAALARPPLHRPQQQPAQQPPSPTAQFPEKPWILARTISPHPEVPPAPNTHIPPPPPAT